VVAYKAGGHLGAVAYKAECHLGAVAYKADFCRPGR
jgi:hypothetical protein